MELLPLLIPSFCFLTLSGLTFGAESVTSVIVKEDDDAILPCSLSTNENIESIVFDWKKEETVQVFMYNKGDHHNNGLTDQNEQFKSRVTHFPEELKHGNASIRIKETKREDKGNYTCFFPKSRKIFKVELVVGAAPKPYVKLLKEKGLLECEVPGAYPKPTVEWQDSDNKTLFSKTLRDIEDKNRFYITIQTSVTKPGCYRCVATQMAKWHQIPSETCVPDVPEPNTGLIVAVAGLAGVLAVVVVGILVWCYFKNKKKNKQEGVV
uniref:Ig-like domain-containing protein n=1 Tax=Haplochromis burtoni TaxID=8153 RepID=A0A3Q2X486_HAPBU